MESDGSQIHLTCHNLPGSKNEVSKPAAVGWESGYNTNTCTEQFGQIFIYCFSFGRDFKVNKQKANSYILIFVVILRPL